MGYAPTLRHRRGRGLLVRLFAFTMSVLPFLSDAAIAYPSVLVPDRGTYVGSWVGPRSGESDLEAIRRVEHGIGRSFAIDHRYYRWDEVLPSRLDKASRRAGKLPFVSWKAMRTDGSIVPWSEIASGTYDDWITEQARRFRRFEAPLYVTFHHEPENDPQFGTPSEYGWAFRHIVEIFRAERVRNVAFVWTMMAWTFNERSGRDPMAWYPGDEYVDIVGADGFNWFPLRPNAPWASFHDIFAPTMSFAKDRGKPVFVVEYAVMEDPDDPDRKANWFRDVANTTKRWPNLKALLYYDTIKDGWPWNSDSSQRAFKGYSEMANDRSLSVMPGPRQRA